MTLSALNNNNHHHKYSCQYGTVTYSPDMETKVKISKRGEQVYQLSKTLTISGNFSWTCRFQQLKESDTIDQELNNQALTAMTQCYLAAMPVFEESYQKIFNHSLHVKDWNWNETESVRSRLALFVTELQCNAIDSVVERLGEQQGSLQIKLKWKVIDNKFFFIIHDEGIGMNRDLYEALNLGDKIKSEKKRKGWTLGGAGTGVESARERIKRCKGNLLFSAGKNGGTKVCVSLPLMIEEIPTNKTKGAPLNVKEAYIVLKALKKGKSFEDVQK